VHLEQKRLATGDVVVRYSYSLPLAFTLAVLKPNTELAASQRKLVAVGRCRRWTERRGAFKLGRISVCLIGLDGSAAGAGCRVLRA
jgi:hypothetical protein